MGLQPRVVAVPTEIGYHGSCKFKEKAMWEEKILLLWIFLSRNASTNTKTIYHNSWEIKVMLSTLGGLGSISSRFFFSAHWTCVNFFWTDELCRIPFLPICTSRLYGVHVYIFFQNRPAPHPTPAPPALEMVRPTNCGISHVSYFLCHATCVPRSNQW